jgi:hypothetical protein
VGDPEYYAGLRTKLVGSLMYRVPIDGAGFEIDPLHDLATLMVTK